MVREPRNYSIWGTILRIEATKFLVTVRATVDDYAGPDASFVERVECPTHAAAYEKQVEMVRDLSARLRAQGNKVANVNLDA